MIHQGKELQLAIKGDSRYKNQQEAADTLGISRQTLHYYFRKETFDKEFLQNVNKTLGIFLPSQRNPTNDFHSKNELAYLQEIIESQKEMIALLKKRNQELEDRETDSTKIRKVSGGSSSH